VIIESLVRPELAGKSLDADYRRMAREEARVGSLSKEDLQKFEQAIKVQLGFFS
jgi:hypothetical protein